MGSSTEAVQEVNIKNSRSWKKCEGVHVVIWETSAAVQLHKLQSSGRGKQSQVQNSEKKSL